MKYFTLLFVVLINFSCAKPNYYIQNNQKIELKPLKVQTREQGVDYYLTKQNVKLGVKDTLFVGFHDDKFVDTYIKKYNLKLVKKRKKLYLFKVKNKDLTLEIANFLSLEQDVKFAHPNFKREVKLR